MKFIIKIDLLWFSKITYPNGQKSMLYLIESHQSTVAKCLADVIYRHGVPSTIIHDRAPEFLADVLQDTAFIPVTNLPGSPTM